MEAIGCSFCGALGTPTTMKWACVLDETPHPESDTGSPRGPLCAECAPDEPERWPVPERVHDTMQEAVPEECAPSDDDLEVWIDETGKHDPAFLREAESVIAALIESGELRTTETYVPYGDTSVSLGSEYDMDDVPVAALVSTAYTWWEDGRLTWSKQLTAPLADGTRHAWLETVPEVSK